MYLKQFLYQFIQESDKRVNYFPEREITENIDIDDCDIDMLEPSIGNEMRPIENAIVVSYLIDNICLINVIFYTSILYMYCIILYKF